MSRSFIDCKFFSIPTSASRGPSAIAELLVVHVAYVMVWHCTAWYLQFVDDVMGPMVTLRYGSSFACTAEHPRCAVSVAFSPSRRRVLRLDESFVQGVRGVVAGVVPRRSRAEEDPVDDRHQTQGGGRVRRRPDRVDADQEHQPELQLCQPRPVRRPSRPPTSLL